MKRTYRLAVLVALLLVSLMSLASVFGQEDADTPLGRWVSIACELRPGPQYLRRDFVIEAHHWIGDITVYGDPACAVPTVMLHIEGPIAFGDAVPVADGAVETDFSGTLVSFTPLVREMADYLNSAAPGTCGTDAWEVGTAQDVTPTAGCALFGLEVPFTEYDITLTRGDYLFAGARPLDGSGFPDPDHRATALQVPLIRLQGE